jgi:DNA helicase-2/ATP-dependent DNA helicase PcrA
VVGDIDQTIYTWRGAQIKNILTFERDYPDAQIVTLEENYRSTQTIIEAANQIIAKNENRKEKNLYTNNAAGDPITRAAHASETAEAGYIARKARDLIENGLPAASSDSAQEGVPAAEIAVLYRTNVQSRTLEEAFLNEGVPYQVLGTKFFDRKEVKHLISYIKAALNERNVSDFKRIVNVPPRGIGNATMTRILEGREEQMSPKQQAAAASFRRILEQIRQSAGTQKPSEVVKDTITASGLDAHYKKQGTDEDEERRANMYELATLASKYDVYEDPAEGLEALLEDAALASDQDSLSEREQEERVKLMTVHAAKGLEFDYVFVTGLEEGLFPQDKDDVEDQEEERRLFYVALTRARKKAFLTAASMRTIFGQRMMQVPSQFMDDIDERLIEDEGASPGAGGPEAGSVGMLDDDPIVRIDW